MTPKLNCIKFFFDCPDAEYCVQYHPMETPGAYDVGVLRNGNYIVSFNCYGSANQSHAKDLVIKAIEWQKNQATVTH